MNEQSETAMPAYAQDDVFQCLFGLAELTGITVDFVDDESLGESLTESDPEEMVIMMPDSDEFPSDLSAVTVLAEEMADIMTESAQPKYKVVYIQNDLESSADVISVALVQLAEMAVCAEAEKKYKIIREIQHPD